MSLSELILDEHKEWLNARVNDLTVDGNLTVVGNITFDGSVHILKDLTVDGNTSLQATTSTNTFITGTFAEATSVLSPAASITLTATQALSNPIITNTGTVNPFTLTLPNTTTISPLLTPSQEVIGYTFWMTICATDPLGGDINFSASGDGFFTIEGANQFSHTTPSVQTVPCRISAISPNLLITIFT